jgi:hypothetical protein
MARDHLDYLGVGTEGTIKMDFKERGSGEFHHQSDLPLSKKN